MNKTQLIDALAGRYEGNRRAAAHALESVLDTITREVARGEKVAITGFGSFEKKVRAARMVRNPRTGERIRAKKTAVPKFSAGADLKAVVSGAKKLPRLSATATSAPASKSTAKKATKSTAKKSTASKTAKKSPAKKSTAKKSTAKKATKKSPARKTAKKTTRKTTAPAKKTARKTTAKKTSPAKKTAKKSPARKTAKKTTRRS